MTVFPAPPKSRTKISPTVKGALITAVGVIVAAIIAAKWPRNGNDNGNGTPTPTPQPTTTRTPEPYEAEKIVGVAGTGYPSSHTFKPPGITVKVDRDWSISPENNKFELRVGSRPVTYPDLAVDGDPEIIYVNGKQYKLSVKASNSPMNTIHFRLESARPTPDE